jgi:hypothetical protein
MIHVCFLFTVSTNEENKSGWLASLTIQWLHDDVVTKDIVFLGKGFTVIPNITDETCLANCKAH